MNVKTKKPSSADVSDDGLPPELVASIGAFLLQLQHEGAGPYGRLQYSKPAERQFLSPDDELGVDHGKDT